MSVIRRYFKLALLGYVALYAALFGMLYSVFFVPFEPRELPWFRYVILTTSALFLVRYILYMFVSPIYDISWKREKKRSAMPIAAYTPKVSVIIPAWNEQVGILSTVRSLLASSYRNLEIIVINDGSTDLSDEIMTSFIDKRNARGGKNDIALRYRYKENGGKASALNSGIAMAKGEIIVSIDADCFVHRDFVKNIVARFANPKVMAAVGNVQIGNTSTFIGMVQHLEFLMSFFFKRADSLFGSIYIIGGAAGAFRREIFEKIGLYTKVITEDIELSVRIQKAGMKIVYANDALVYTEGASDLSSLLKQRLRWKRGRIDTFVRHKDLFFSTSKHHNRFLTWCVMPLAVLGDALLMLDIPFILLLYSYALLTHDFWPFLVSVIVMALLVVVQFCTSERKFVRKSMLLLAPITYLMMYAVVYVELHALVKSLWSYVMNKEVRWQKWQRTGVARTS